MRLMLHILEKDARRLSWQIAVTLVLLAALARMDAGRADFIPGSAEGWLTPLVPAAVVVAGAGVVLSRYVDPFSSPWVAVDEVRRGLALLTVAVAAVAVVVLQYARRRTIFSRTLAVAGLLIAAVLFACMPRNYTFALQGALSPVPVWSGSTSLHIAPRSEEPP